MVKVLMICLAVNIFISLTKASMLESYWAYTEGWYKDFRSIFFTFYSLGKYSLNTAGKVLMLLLDILCLPASIALATILYGCIGIVLLFNVLFVNKENR